MVGPSTSSDLLDASIAPMKDLEAPMDSGSWRRSSLHRKMTSGLGGRKNDVSSPLHGGLSHAAE